MSRYKRTTPKQRRTRPEWERMIDTCDITGLSRQAIINKIQRGEILAVKSGAALLINVASRQQHFANLPRAYVEAAE
jgi:hypothetical protein